MAERRSWRRLVESYTVDRGNASGVPQCGDGSASLEGCWPGDVGVARVGAMMCRGALESRCSHGATKRYVMGHPRVHRQAIATPSPRHAGHRPSSLSPVQRHSSQPHPHRLRYRPPYDPPRPPRLPTPYRSPSTARQPHSNFSPPCRREYSRVDAQAAPGSHSSSSCC
jgi:hypothetical protein